MGLNNQRLWERYKKYLYHNSKFGFTLDISRMNFPRDYFTQMEEKIQRAYQAMEKLEKGVIANPDENRMVGHYWLRAPELAFDKEIKTEIENSLRKIKEFTHKVHSGEILSEKQELFKNVLIIGIGGSSLGPQLAADALGKKDHRMTIYFLDNTDPDGMDRVFNLINRELDETLVIVISKSGGTIETRNGMLEVKQRYSAQGLDFSRHVVCITQYDSKLDKIAKSQGWLERFPLWDWVGGRTSITSPVGLLPCALQGIDIDAFLEGSRRCDEITRQEETLANPAAMLALMWYFSTEIKGSRQMVILPYKDRLQLFSKYLQQLIMESLGKEKDLDNKAVNQGITVFGNKGSTDQHSYVQQLLDGPGDFFVTFIEVLKDRENISPEVEDGVTSGDYLHAFFLGTRRALTEKDRESITITIEKIEPFTLGFLIALFERAVGLYASLVNINAYHQPAVEAGKKAAAKAINIHKKILYFLSREKGKGFTAQEIAQYIGEEGEIETVFKILMHLSSNLDHGVTRETTEDIFTARFYIS